MSSSVLAQKELPHLLSGLELFYELRGTWEPEVMDKRPRVMEKQFLHSGRGTRHAPRSSGALFLGNIFRARILEGAAGYEDGSPLNQQGGRAGGVGCREGESPGA